MVQSGFIQVQVVVHPLLCVTKDIRPFVYALVLGPHTVQDQGTSATAWQMEIEAS